MLAILCFSCGHDKLLKDENFCRANGPLSTIRFGEREFDLDDQLSKLMMKIEILSEVTDDAYVLVSLHDEIERTADSIFLLYKGYKGYSIENFSIRSYGILPFNSWWQIPLVPEEKFKYLLTKDTVWYSDLPILPYKIILTPQEERLGPGYYYDGLKYFSFEEGVTPCDFPVYVKKIRLKKGKNVEQIRINFEQRIRSGNWNLPENNPIISLAVVRWNDQIQTQIVNYPWNFQPSLADRITYNQYFKAFSDSSLTSFVFSNFYHLQEMSKLYDEEDLFEGYLFGEDIKSDLLTDGYLNITIYPISYRLTYYLSQERYEQTMIP